MGFVANEQVYAPCPCGSGKKYKFCCLPKDREERKAKEPRPSRLEKLLDSFGGGLGLGRASDDDDILVWDHEAYVDPQEEGFALLQKGRTREAVECFERAVKAAPFLPHAHNNLALACFHDGQVERALRIVEEVDREILPGDVFALASRVHYALVLGLEREAEEALARMESFPPRDEFATAKKCEALARFKAHAKILQAVQEETGAGETAADLAFFAGTALANLGRFEEAEACLAKAAAHAGRGPRARRYLDLLRRREAPPSLEGGWPYLEPHELASRALLEGLRSSAEARRWPGLVDALLARVSDLPQKAKELMPLLRCVGTPRALEALRSIATGTFGPDELRLSAFQELAKAGVLGAGASLRLWLQGEWKTIECRVQEITSEAASAFPPELCGRLDGMLEAVRAGDLTEAEGIGLELLSKAPDYPKILQNMAFVRHSQGRTAEAMDLLRRAMEIDPSYLFAPAGLAMQLLEEGDVDEAHHVLERVQPPARVAPDAQICLLSAQATLALAEGAPDRALAVLKAIEMLDPEAEILERFGGTSGLEEMQRIFERFRDLALKREEKRRRRLLSADASFEECFEASSREDLCRMAAGIGLSGASGLKKGPLFERLAAHLVSRLGQRGLLEMQPEETVAALRDVSRAGGVLSFDEFTRRHCSEQPRRKRAPAGGGGGAPDAGPRPLNRLRELGLAVEGTVGGRESVIIPKELRGPLERHFANAPPADRRGFDPAGS